MTSRGTHIHTRTHTHTLCMRFDVMVSKTSVSMNTKREAKRTKLPRAGMECNGHGVKLKVRSASCRSHCHEATKSFCDIWAFQSKVAVAAVLVVATTASLLPVEDCGSTAAPSCKLHKLCTEARHAPNVRSVKPTKPRNLLLNMMDSSSRRGAWLASS